MIKKIVLKNGKEVKVGDIVSLKLKVEHPDFGEFEVIKDITVTENNMVRLLAKGYLEGKIVVTEEKSLDYYVKVMAKKYDYSYSDIVQLLDEIYNINRGAVLSILLKEIAVELDKKYNNHISKSKVLYVVNSANGTISEIDPDKVTTFDAFAAFRTIEDATLACEIIKDIHKDIFDEKE